jgi:F0F1-type ATP synthase membrane subunit b/b'
MTVAVAGEPAEPASTAGPDGSVTAAPARSGSGVGFRLEALLAAAEREAAEIREQAEAHAAALLTQAHAELDRHDDDLQRRWRERDDAIAERERRLRADETEAREQVAQVLDAAEHQAQTVLARARLEARALIDAAREDAGRQLARSRAECERLDQRRERAHAEIARILRTLDGLRAALAYELDAVHIGDPEQPVDLDSADPAPRHPHDGQTDGYVDPAVAPPALVHLSPAASSPARASVTDRADGWLLGRRRADHRRVPITGLDDPPD